MNILITGCNGQLGNEMQLLEKQHPEHTYYNTDVNELDITNRQAIEAFVNEHEIDGIVNCAAYTAVDKAEDNQQLCDLLNRVAPGYLGEAIEQRGGWLINESGLYSLILLSKLPKAKEFKHWVTAEVLPAIRKHGVYATQDFSKQAISNPAWAIEILTALQQEREEKERLKEVVEVQAVQIAEMKPKASYYALILQSKEAIPVSVIAKDYRFSGRVTP